MDGGKKAMAWARGNKKKLIVGGAISAAGAGYVGYKKLRKPLKKRSFEVGLLLKDSSR